MPQVRFPPLDRTEKSDNTSLQGSAPHLCVLARPQGTGAGAAAVLVGVWAWICAMASSRCHLERHVNICS